MTSLQVQLQTSEKVLELTRNVSTLTDCAKEASKVSLQIADILLLINDYHSTTDAIYDISNSIKVLRSDAQGIISRSKHTMTSHSLLFYRGKGPADTGLVLDPLVHAKAP